MIKGEIELEALIKQLQRMLGYVPVGTKDLIKVLSHPDVIRLTRDYLNAVDVG